MSQSEHAVRADTHASSAAERLRQAEGASSKWNAGFSLAAAGIEASLSVGERLAEVGAQLSAVVDRLDHLEE